MKKVRSILTIALFSSLFSSAVLADHNDCRGMPDGPVPPVGTCTCHNEAMTCSAR